MQTKVKCSTWSKPESFEVLSLQIPNRKLASGSKSQSGFQCQTKDLAPTSKRATRSIPRTNNGSQQINFCSRRTPLHLKLGHWSKSLAQSTPEATWKPKRKKRINKLQISCKHKIQSGTWIPRTRQLFGLSMKRTKWKVCSSHQCITRRTRSWIAKKEDSRISRWMNRMQLSTILIGSTKSISCCSSTRPRTGRRRAPLAATGKQKTPRCPSTPPISWASWRALGASMMRYPRTRCTT